VLERRELNSLMASVLGLPKLYDVRCGISDAYKQHAYIVSAWGIDYADNIKETFKAVSKLAQKDNHTFVLSFEDGEWRAAYGDYKDCEEYRGANPAYCSCMALLKFMGKV